MKAPESLPGELFLLAYDSRKGRLTQRTHLGHMLRAAALAELWLGGQIVDTDGKANPGKAKAEAPDPLSRNVLGQVTDTPGKKWHHWVRKDTRAAVGVVRDRLEADRVIKVEKYRVLGLFPGTRITLRQPQVASRLVSRVGGAVRGSQALSRVAPRDAVLTTLVTTGALNVVVSRAQRRQAKTRIAQLNEVAGPVPGALRKVIRDANAAAASGG